METRPFYILFQERMLNARFYLIIDFNGLLNHVESVFDLRRNTYIICYGTEDSQRISNDDEFSTFRSSSYDALRIIIDEVADSQDSGNFISLHRLLSDEVVDIRKVEKIQKLREAVTDRFQIQEFTLSYYELPIHGNERREIDVLSDICVQAMNSEPGPIVVYVKEKASEESRNARKVCQCL
ncbi:hypothetical protein HA402_013692 [Bradysia odoriphaga]|nr:hypothetical protein HA402_013692 [Bradysia odoriphaga]